MVLLFLLVMMAPSSTGGLPAAFPDEEAVTDPVPMMHSDTARCYSCMSRLYEAVWPSLRTLYKRPKNFTDRCDDEVMEESGVPTVNCPTICVSMIEEPNIAGIRVRGHIRGCMSDVLLHGFNGSIVQWYRWMQRDSCRSYRKKELFKLTGDYHDDSTIEVCTCYSDHCNSGRMVSSSMFICLAILAVSRQLFGGFL